MAIPLDKQAHALAGYCIAATFCMVPHPVMPWIGPLVAAVIGWAKEWVIDKGDTEHHTVDPMDFLATAVGGAAALAVWLVIQVVASR